MRRSSLTEAAGIVAFLSIVNKVLGFKWVGVWYFGCLLDNGNASHVN